MRSPSSILFFLLPLLLILATPAVATAATFTVTSIADAGAGSLRDAIASANSTAGNDVIEFDIAEGDCSAAGVCTIVLSSPLPVVTATAAAGNVVIDGTTQPQFGTAPDNVCATDSADSYMRIEVIWASTDITARMLQIDGSAVDSEILGLSLASYWDLSVSTSGRTRVYCNHFTVIGEGTAKHALSNFAGIIIEGALGRGVIIGTDGDGIGDLSERNVFAGGYGVYINANNENVIAGNYFGFASDGVTPLSSGNTVFIRQTSDANLVGSNQDGTSDDLERNLIGNCATGVLLASSSVGGLNEVAGNWIGVDVTGAPASCSSGIVISNIQTDYRVTRNLIANNGWGLRVTPDSGLSVDSFGNCIEGNTVGFELTSSVSSVFTGNYWGAPDGPSGIGSGSGDSITQTGTGVLTYDPWSTDPEVCTVPEPSPQLLGAFSLATLALVARLRRRGAAR